jgi:hypothetical protein
MGKILQTKKKNNNNNIFCFFFSYCNSRIIKFNRKGEYIMEWGSPMSGKRDSKFEIVG